GTRRYTRRSSRSAPRQAGSPRDDDRRSPLPRQARWTFPMLAAISRSSTGCCTLELIDDAAEHGMHELAQFVAASRGVGEAQSAKHAEHLPHLVHRVRAAAPP